MMEPRQRASLEQFSVLIDFMERNGDLSRPQPGPQGRLKSDKLWLELATILNSQGGGVSKSVDKWKKVWADWKTKTKKKCLLLRAETSGTGGGPRSATSLTALEERVIAIIGLPAVVGQRGIQEHGFNDGHANELSEPPNDAMLEDHGSQNIAPASPLILDLPLVFLGQSSMALPPSPIPIPAAAGPPTTPTLAPPTPSPAPPAHQHPPAPTPAPRANRHRRRQLSVSPTTPHRTILTARRNRGITPFERAASLFSSVEERRHIVDRHRDQQHHEREMERMQIEAERVRIEAERVEVSRQHNVLLQQLCQLGQQFMDFLNHQPSTDGRSV